MTQAILEAPKTESQCTLHLRPAVELTDEQFFALCQINRDLRLERTAEGDLIVMPPTGWLTGSSNANITKQIRLWSEQDGTGIATDSSAGFKLPIGSERSPDAAWVRRSRLAKLRPEQLLKFLPLAPDFAIELKSPSDALTDVLAKMDEYIASGVRLGWLINPETRQVHIYRPDMAVEILDNPLSVSGEPELPAFVLDLSEIWEPDI